MAYMQLLPLIVHHRSIIFGVRLCIRWQNRQINDNPHSKVCGANMGPIWVLSAPDGPHVGPMNLAIREVLSKGPVAATEHIWCILSGWENLNITCSVFHARSSISIYFTLLVFAHKNGYNDTKSNKINKMHSHLSSGMLQWSCFLRHIS